MKGMSSGRVSVVRRLLMVPAFMMLRGFPMVMGGVGMMLRRFLVVFASFLRHWFSSFDFAYRLDNCRCLVSCEYESNANHFEVVPPASR
jgi:hypothetical protein